MIMNSLSKEIPRFLVAGFSAVGTDMLFYYLLLNFLSHSPAKAVSFLSGTVVAFFINKYWTFGKKQKSYKEICLFACLYLFTLSVNVGINRLLLGLFPNRVFLAFLAATGTSTVLNFVGQKFIVFK